ncbi:MAG: ATP-dependent helicase HrpB [Cyanobacteria bacterium SZAS TMP-1]|nr:ATP-dependent helicase HrpB [Cyanobacteria bacterium SZAS TMP-1]
MEALPIDDVLPQIVGALKESGALVLKAEPGAGKTTRVPPAILDAGLAQLESKKPGQIVVLQPRRVAARSAAARISAERGTALGANIGYSVRGESKTSRDTRILVCTTGVFLRKLQDDPSIEDTAVVVFDEFHERSVDSDLALALTQQVRREIRPDLKIVVMSATLESAPIAAYLENCPAIDCPGRTFPIEQQYLSHHSSESIDRLAAEGVERMLPKTDGDLLVFLPGVGEIRQTEALLESLADKHDLAVLPLYGDMSLSDQQAVLQPCPKRKVVLSTNVAETSLTIAGVTAVIDSGFARVNRFDPCAGINRLELSRISKASATQRAGRAGRTAAGHCLRLWSEREQTMLPDFEFPEIERVDLSECVLKLIAWGERDVHGFNWYEKPPVAAIDRALELLERLGATQQGQITETGKAMAALPLQPRLARLMIEGARLGQGKRTALCAALLSERDPFRPPDPRARAEHHTDSDVLAAVHALEEFDENKTRDSILGEVLSGPARQVLRTADQLLRLVSNKATKSNIDADEAVLRAIMSAYPDRICKRRQPREPRGVMVGGRGVKLAEQSTVCDAQLFVAVDMMDLNKSELAVRRASAVERNWLPKELLNTSVEVAYDAVREKVVAFKRTRFCDLLLDEAVASIPPDVDPGTVLAEAVLANVDLSTLIDEEARDYLARIDCLRELLPELNFPDLGENPWPNFLPTWCCGCSSLAELRASSLVAAMQSSLSAEQIAAVERDAPLYVNLPSGRRVKLQYEHGKQPVLAARIQEVFGMADSPRIAGGRQPVMMHLLAPNYRVQQITNDLGSFWKNTYPEIKKELKGRYPKHSWPDDPMAAQPYDKIQRKK